VSETRAILEDARQFGEKWLRRIKPWVTSGEEQDSRAALVLRGRPRETLLSRTTRTLFLPGTKVTIASPEGASISSSGDSPALRQKPFFERGFTAGPDLPAGLSIGSLPGEKTMMKTLVLLQLLAQDVFEQALAGPPKVERSRNGW